jgi:hypothetical protein
MVALQVLARQSVWSGSVLKAAAIVASRVLAKYVDAIRHVSLSPDALSVQERTLSRGRLCSGMMEQHEPN